MPHSLYLGSDLVKARLRDYDLRHTSPPNPLISSGFESAGEATHRPSTTSADEDAKLYRPSLQAIQSCLTFSIWELAISLFTFALFVNSAILIVAGASLSNLPEDEISNADIFAIHDLLSSTLAPAAGTIFALALLFSGTSAGIVCTMAGQIVSEGQLQWRISPWKRRLITRAISIVPSIAVAGTLGRHGLNTALEGTQVALSISLPFCTAPLIWFTCKAKIMKVWTDDEGQGEQREVVRVDSGTVGAGAGDEEDENNHKFSRILARACSSVKRVGVREVQGAETGGGRFIVIRNNLVTSIIAVVVWLFLIIMNGALIVLAIMGKNV
jgi:metal iron transporter